MDESISSEAVDFYRKICEYAWERYGIRILVDAEIRLSRKAFLERYPGKQSEILRIGEMAWEPGAAPFLEFRFDDLRDNYSHNYSHSAKSARLVKAWSYRKNNAGEILLDTVGRLHSAAGSRRKSSRDACPLGPSSRKNPMST